MTHKVLIVDDNKGCSDLYKLRFEIEKWEVVVAFSAEEALEKVRQDYRPDIILLDLMLPKMQGDELLKILKADEKLKKIPVMILTAISFNPKDEDKTRGLADDYQIKIEITPQKLVQRATQLIENTSRG